MLPPGSCNICGRTFRSVESMKSHLAYAHRRWRYGCCQCLRRFYARPLLVRHCVAAHSAKVSHQIERSEMRLDYGNDCSHTFRPSRSHVTYALDKRQHGCAQCLKRFYAKPALVRHCVKSHGMEVAPCAEFETIPNASFDCIDFLRTRKSTKTTRIAKENKTKERVKPPRLVRPKMHYACEFCTKLFSNRLIWAMHLRTVHSQDRPFVCEHCGKTFRYPSSKRKHVVNKHKFGKSFNVKDMTNHLHTEHPRAEETVFVKVEWCSDFSEQKVDGMGCAAGATHKQANAADVHLSSPVLSAALPSSASASMNRVAANSVGTLPLIRFAASVPRAVSSSLPVTVNVSGLNNFFESTYAVRAHACCNLRYQCSLCQARFPSVRARTSHFNRAHGLRLQRRRRPYGSAQVRGVQCLDATIAELLPPCTFVANAVPQQPAVIQQPCTPMLQSRDQPKPAHQLTAAQQRPLILRLAPPLTSLAHVTSSQAPQRVTAGPSAAQPSLPFTTSSFAIAVRVPSSTTQLVKIAKSGKVVLLRKEPLDDRQLNKDTATL